MRRKQVGRLSVSVTLGIVLLALGLLGLGLFHAPAGVRAEVVLNSLTDTYTQTFDVLDNGVLTTYTTLPAGWTLFEAGTSTRVNQAYAADTGGSNTGDTYSYGASGSTERALGSLLAGTISSTLGVSFTNKTGVLVSSLAITYTCEQWRLGATGRYDRLDFQYSTDAISLTSGTWSDVDALDCTGVLSTGPTGAKDGNANRATVSALISGLNIAPDQTFWLRWADYNASGADDGLAIDDFYLTPYATIALTLTKSVIPATTVAYHGNVTYTLVLRNAGGLTETAAFLTDTLPTAVDFASWVEQNGATVTNDELTWNGEIAPASAITFTFVATHTGDYGEVVTNTAEFSGTAQAGTAQAAFSVAENLANVTFVYHDLEDVVQTGDSVYLAGSFNGWNTTALALNADSGNTLFSTTVQLAVGTPISYKYIVYTGTVGTNTQYDWLNTNNREYTPTGTLTKDDYRHVVVDWAKLQWPSTLQVNLGDRTDTIYGRLLVNGVTSLVGEGRGLKAEAGYGNTATPADWTWFPMVYNTDDNNNDEFMGVMTPTAGGVYSYAVRFDGNWGTGNPNAGWTYGDLDGVVPGGDPFELDQTGVLTVVTWDLGIAKSAVPAEVYLHTGESALVTYTIRVDNLSLVTDTTRFTVSDVLPEGFVYVSDDSGITPSGTGADDDPLVWGFTTSLTHGTSLTFQLVASIGDAVAQSGRYTNTATVAADPADWVSTNNTAETGVMVWRVLTIGEARQQPFNSVVVVEGTVTAEPGIFKESSNPNRKMYIQDATGGFQVYRAAQLPTVARDAIVRVTGVISEYRTEMECIVANTTDVVDLGAGVAVTPQVTQTGVISEPLEGQLVTIEGFITNKPNAYSFQMDDGSGNVWVYRYYNLGQTTDPNYIDFSALLVGDYVRVTGVTRGYDYSGVVRREVLPRGPADVTELYPITFVYHDVEDVVQAGETVKLAGDFTAWGSQALTMTANPDNSVFTVTATLATTGTHAYKYIVVSGSDQWDWLNTADRSVNVTAPATVHDYRQVAVGYAHLMGPAAITMNLGESTGPITGEVYIQNVTNPAGVGRAVWAELGYGTSADPAAWTWVPLTFAGLQNGNNDLYAATLTPAASGVYSYAVRFDGNRGAGNPNAGWTYGDLDGVHPGDPFELDQTGVLIVNAPNLTTSAKVSSAAGGAVQPGALVTYTITLNNTGATATVRVTDTLGAYYTVFSAGDFQQPVTGTLTWSGVVTAGQSVTLHFVAQVKAMAQLPLGTTILHNLIQVDDGLAAPFNVADANPPTVTVRAIYVPLVLRNK